MFWIGRPVKRYCNCLLYHKTGRILKAPEVIAEKIMFCYNENMNIYEQIGSFFGGESAPTPEQKVREKKEKELMELRVQRENIEKTSRLSGNPAGQNFPELAGVERRIADLERDLGLEEKEAA